MASRAFFAAAAAAVTGSAWIGLLAGIAASLVLSAIHGVASITFRGNQLISGVAINFLAAGITVLIGQYWFALGGRTPQLEGAARFAPIDLPLAATLAQVPVIGPVYADVLFGTGIVHEPTGATDGDGNPVTAAVPGYHVNLLVPDAWEPPAALASKVVTPASPACVFCQIDVFGGDA